jgi:sulfonate transport system permease protein
VSAAASVFVAPRWRRSIGRGGISVAGPLLLLALWYLATRHAGNVARVLVPPGRVLTTLLHLIVSGELAMHLRQSLARLAYGFAAGALSGLVFGVLMGVSRRVEAIFGPSFHALRQIPSIAFIPVLILLFGVEETFKVVVVMKACFFPVALATADGVRGVPLGFVEVARVLALSRLQLVRYVLLPAAVPPVITGLRIALARSWMVLVAAELLAAESGLGQMMEMGRQMFRIDVVLVGVFITGVFGFLLDGAMRGLERSLAPWRQTA